jgi:hypothetical protein
VDNHPHDRRREPAPALALALDKRVVWCSHEQARRPGAQVDGQNRVVIMDMTVVQGQDRERAGAQGITECLHARAVMRFRRFPSDTSSPGLFL